MIRTMTMEDYDGVYALWTKIRGFGLRSVDDSREGIERFLKRNPATSVVAVEDGKVVSTAVLSCAATTGGGAACTMYAWMRITAGGALARRWSCAPWRNLKKSRLTRCA